MAPKRSKKPSSALASGGTTTGVPPEPLRQTASTPADSPPPSAADSPPPSAADSPPPSAADSPPPSAADSPTSSTADPPKLPPAAWKTGVQLEFMLSKFSLYLTHQNEGKLDRFWPPIFDYWQKTWPIDPPATAVKKHGGRENAIVVIRRETQVRIRAWFHNAARAGSKPPTTTTTLKPDLRLNQSEKRMLAPVQAYCAYAWDSGLRDLVISEWEKEKQSHMSTDEDDPTPGSATGSGSHIPISFKLKVAKTAFNELSDEQKQEVNTRREEERNKLYRTIPTIKDREEREEKLHRHLRNQPSASKSLFRILKNLEDQAGCVAQLFIGYVDPKTGEPLCEGICQGKTESGLTFREFIGTEFDAIEKRFKDWSLRGFGEKGTKRRELFMLSDAPPGNQQATSSSTLDPQISDAATVEQFDNPQASEAAQVVAAQTPPPLVNRPTDTGSGTPTSPQLFESPQFVNSADDFTFVSPTLHESPPVTPLVLKDLPTTHGHPITAPSPVLGSSQVTTPRQVPKPQSLVTPSPLGSSQAISNQAVISPTVAGPLSVIPPPVLGFSQPVTPHQDVTAPTFAQQQTTSSPQVIQGSRAAVVYPPSNLAEGVVSGNSGVAAIPASAYKLQSKATATPPIRRDSIEGVPDIALFLSPSGYQLSPQQDPPITPEESILTTPSTTPSPDELVVPSSQQSLEECLAIMPSVDDPNPPPSQQSPGEVLTISGGLRADTAPGHFRFAPRIIPDYRIDRSDFPSWLLDRVRLDFVLSVEAGDIWKKLIITWLRQERRVGFGLNEKLGANLPLRQKPGILKDYFKWHHTPSKGDSVTLPEFGDEVALWWGSIQPNWRYKDEYPPDPLKDYSFILAGGKKGVFLLILCLAWWDREFGRGREKEKVRRREAARTAGRDVTTLNFDDLCEHDSKWFNILNDLIFVMEHAQRWPVPGDGTHTVAVAPVRKKRATKQGEGSSPRKKSKSKSS